MSWQDELAQLDSALASGQISADEYRLRRDRVIAQASGQSAPEQPQQQGGDPTQVFRPVNPQTQEPGFDRTQVVGPGGDRTQVVNGGDADSTQIVPNMPPPQFPPPQPPPAWETAHPQQPNMSPPPWANEELPPEFGQQSWPRQGPEVFEEKSGGGSGKTIGIIIAVVLVLALAGGAVWFFGFKDKGNPQAEETQTSQPEETQTTTTPPPPDIPDGPFIELPGEGEEAVNGTFPIQEAVASGLPEKNEATLLQSVGISEVAGLATDEDEMRRGIWAFKMGDGADRDAVLAAMEKLYNDAQYELVTQENGIFVRKLAAKAPGDLTVFRAHYLYEDYLVRVEVYGPDPATVETEFNDILAQETEKYPPSS